MVQKVALVTGAAAGIGAACSERIFRSGSGRGTLLLPLVLADASMGCPPSRRAAPKRNRRPSRTARNARRTIVELNGVALIMVLKSQRVGRWSDGMRLLIGDNTASKGCQ